MTLRPEDPGDIGNNITWNDAFGGWLFTTSGEARIQNVIDRNGYVEVVIGRSLENLTLTWSDSVDSVYYCS